MLDLRFYFALFLRRLPYFLIFTVAGAAVGLALAFTLPPSYQAQARLVVESEQIPDELAASTVRTEATEQLQIIQQRILCLLYTSPSPRDRTRSRMPSSA